MNRSSINCSPYICPRRVFTSDGLFASIAKKILSMVKLPTGILVGRSKPPRSLLSLLMFKNMAYTERKIHNEAIVCHKNPKTLPFVMLQIEFVFLSYKSSVNSVKKSPFAIY